MSEGLSLTDYLLHEEQIDLYEMANLSSKLTGLNNIIVWVNGGASELQHGPRIKIARDAKVRRNQMATIPLTGMPRVLGDNDLTQNEFSDIVKWIELNREAILQYSYDNMTTDEFINMIKKV